MAYVTYVKRALQDEAANPVQSQLTLSHVLWPAAGRLRKTERKELLHSALRVLQVSRPYIL